MARPDRVWSRKITKIFRRKRMPSAAIPSPIQVHFGLLDPGILAHQKYLVMAIVQLQRDRQQFLRDKTSNVVAFH